MNLANLDIGELADGAKMLLENFSEGDLEQLVKTVFEGATLGTEGHEYPLMQVMDEKLSGRVMTLLKGVWFALQVNFGDFFGALRASAGAEAPLLKSKA
jgi:hypothetical protein